MESLDLTNKQNYDISFENKTILSAEDLVAYKKRLDRSVPHTGGPKGYAPSGSWLEKKQVDFSLTQMKEILSDERVQRVGDLSRADWDPQLQKAVVTKQKGQMEVYYEGMPLSIQAGYGYLLKNREDLYKYQVYSHLSRLGYTVVKHQGKINITQYERKLRIDQHIKKMKRKHCEVRNESTIENNVVGMADVITIDKPERNCEEPRIVSPSECSNVNGESVSNGNSKAQDCQQLDDIEVVYVSRKKDCSSVYDNVSTFNLTESSSNTNQLKADTPADEPEVIYMSPSMKQRNSSHLEDLSVGCNSQIDSKCEKKQNTFEFPNMYGKEQVILTKPPACLIPSNITFQQDSYVFDVRFMTVKDTEKKTKTLDFNRRSGSFLRHKTDKHRNSDEETRERRSRDYDRQNFRNTEKSTLSYCDSSQGSSWQSSNWLRNDDYNLYSRDYRNLHARNLSDPGTYNQQFTSQVSFHQGYSNYPVPNQFPTHASWSYYGHQGQVSLVGGHKPTNIMNSQWSSHSPHMFSRSHGYFQRSDAPNLSRDSTCYGEFGREASSSYSHCSTNQSGSGNERVMHDQNTNTRSYGNKGFSKAVIENQRNESKGSSEALRKLNDSSHSRRDHGNEFRGTCGNKRKYPLSSVENPDDYISLIPKLNVSVSNWNEFKKELFKKESLEKLLDGPGSVLWKGVVKPLVQPVEDLAVGHVWNKLNVIQGTTLTSSTSCLGKSAETKFQIDYDVYLPNMSFRKSTPTIPSLRVVVTWAEDAVPTLADVVVLQRNLCDNVPLQFAVVDNGDLAFYSFHDVSLPSYIPLTW
ncbi:uncharacterized protein LOC143239751 isoform X2 [Tachypleus tridentatus]|uniref:uncharacterized protein LOC143239751 isoform X2 n=1 Tax=Tachypleus tridentatus TaxID=6853 RepID=UPI003FD59F8B